MAIKTDKEIKVDLPDEEEPDYFNVEKVKKEIEMVEVTPKRDWKSRMGDNWYVFIKGKKIKIPKWAYEQLRKDETRFKD